MLNLVWNKRSDGVICAEPYGLCCWYYIAENQLQIVNRCTFDNEVHHKKQ